MMHGPIHIRLTNIALNTKLYSVLLNQVSKFSLITIRQEMVYLTL